MFSPICSKPTNKQLKSPLGRSACSGMFHWLWYYCLSSLTNSICMIWYHFQLFIIYFYQHCHMIWDSCIPLVSASCFCGLMPGVVQMLVLFGFALSVCCIFWAVVAILGNSSFQPKNQPILKPTCAHQTCPHNVKTAEWTSRIHC